MISLNTRRDVLILVDRKQLPTTSHSSTKEKVVNTIRTGPLYHRTDAGFVVLEEVYLNLTLGPLCLRDRNNNAPTKVTFSINC